MTSGLIATARAMHRRCCCPPERPRPLDFSLSLTSFHSAARRSADSTRPSSSRLRQFLVEPHAEGDVVVDRHRERRRLLEHHADAGAQQIEIDVRRENVLAVEHDLALGALIGIEIVHAVEDAQQRRLAAARRADEGRHLALVDGNVMLLSASEFAVIEFEVAALDRSFSADPPACVVRAAVSHTRCHVACSLALSCGERARDDAERQDGERDDQRAGPGELLPFLVGAQRELEDHRPAGSTSAASRSMLQNWLLSAVNSSGAVSPADPRHRQQNAGQQAGRAAR